MTTYRLTIDGPRWRSLSAKNGKTRSTLRDATDLAWRAMWDALDGLSLLDRQDDQQCAQKALAACAAWNANGYPDGEDRVGRHEIGPFVFTITMEK